MFRRHLLPNSNRSNRATFEQQIAACRALFEQGRFIEAAQTFENLAQIAAARSGPRAPRFYMQAGRSYLHARQVQKGMALLEQGKNLAVARSQLTPLVPLAAHIQVELQQLGLPEQANQVAAWLAGLPAAPAPLSPPARPVLPLHCPSCGAPVHPDQVTWLDVQTAECTFCGSPLR